MQKISTPNMREDKSVPATEAAVYLKSDCALAEGPVWDNETLYWVDITGRAIFAKYAAAVSPEKYEMPLEVGSFVLWKNDQIVLATEKGFHVFNLRTRELELLFDPEAALPDNRFNDGKCDPRGRFVAGTLSRRRAPEAALYLLDLDRSVRELFRPVTCSNGLAWAADGTVLYHIDTPTCCVRAFDYDLASGCLSNERVVIRLPLSHGKPDGMTIDCNGNLWIALWDGWAVECWNPITGEPIACVDVPVARVTSCVFGGKNYDTLFITTAQSGLDESALAEQEFAGSIFCAQPGVRGFPAIRFQGYIETRNCVT